MYKDLMKDAESKIEKLMITAIAIALGLLLLIIVIIALLVAIISLPVYLVVNLIREIKRFARNIKWHGKVTKQQKE